MTNFSSSPEATRRPAPWVLIGLALVVLSAGVTAGAVFVGCRHADTLHYLFSGEALSRDETRSLLTSLLEYGLGWPVLWFVFATALWRLSRRESEGAPFVSHLGRAAWPFVSWCLAAPVLLLLRFEEIQHIVRSTSAICLGLFLAMIWRLFRYWPLTAWLRKAGAAPGGETANAPSREEARSRRFLLGWSLEARILGVCAVVYFVAFTAMSWLRHMNFYSLLTDQGIYTQLAWSLLHGEGFHCTVYQELVNDNMLSEHVMPIMALLAPLYALWSDPRMLLLVQSVAITLAVWPIYRISLWFTGEGDEAAGHRPFALVLALSFLLHPQLQTSHLFDFHPDAFLPLFMGLAIWALLRGRWRLYWPVLVLALMCKEDTSMPVALLGIYAALFRRRRLAGALTFALGVVWFYVTVEVITPAYRGGDYRHMEQYGRLVAPFIDGDPGSVGPLQLSWILLKHPVAIVSEAMGFLQLNGVAQMFGPTLATSILAPAELALAAPHLLATLLSDDPFKQGIEFHYSFTMLAYIYTAAAAGAARLARWVEKRASRSSASGHRGPSARTAVFAFLTVAILASSLFICRWHGESPFSQGFAERKYRLDERWAAGRELVRLVPPDAAVSAQHDVASHLTNRLKIYDYPIVRDAEIIVLNLHTLERRRLVWTFHSPEYYFDTVKKTLESGDWGLTQRRGGFIMLERGADTARNQETIELMSSFLE